jgi:hypothetical protein
VRSARYSASGLAAKGLLMRCESTTCMMSPSTMYCLARRTAALKASSPKAPTPPRRGRPRTPRESLTGSRSLASSSLSRRLGASRRRGSPARHRRPGSACRRGCRRWRFLRTAAAGCRARRAASGFSVLASGLDVAHRVVAEGSPPGRRRSAAGRAGRHLEAVHELGTKLIGLPWSRRSATRLPVSTMMAPSTTRCACRRPGR